MTTCPDGYWSGDVLIDLREEVGLSPRLLAEATGISLSSQQRYERGERVPPADVLIRWARVLGTTPNELLEFVPGGAAA